MSQRFGNPVFCALDTRDETVAAGLARDLTGHVGGVKIGMEYFYATGAQGYRAVADCGLPVFLDLKLHDIPNTVGNAIRSLLALKPAIVNVHAAGGTAMMQAARAAADEAGAARPLVIGVTVLTSLDASDLAAAGVPAAPLDQVRRLAQNARQAGLDGVVCSAHEIGVLRRELGPDFLLVVPGIRPHGTALGDQKRIMTPAEALDQGADILVIGRPITAAPSPQAAARDINTELGLVSS